MKTITKYFIGILIIASLLIQGASGQTIEELRYSSEIENDDKFTFEVEVYTDAGNDVDSDGNQFGTIVAGSQVEITSIGDPSNPNFATVDQEKIFDIFKFEVDDKRISEFKNLGILEFFVMPTQILVSTSSEAKHFINYNFSSYEADINTNAEDNTFDITVENKNFVFETEGLNITSWNLIYNRANGVLQDMTLKAKSVSDSDSVELQVSLATGFLARLPHSWTPIILAFSVLMIPQMIRRKSKSL